MCGLRERKKQQTRERIAAAAVALLSEEGDEHATVARISEQAGVSPRTFHNYFSRRDDAFFFFFETLVNRWLQEITDAPADEAPIDLLKRIIFAQVNLADDDPYSAKNVMYLLDHTSASLGRDLNERAQGLFLQLGNALYERYGGELDCIDAHIITILSFLSGGLALKIGDIAPYKEVLHAVFDILDHGINGTPSS